MRACSPRQTIGGKVDVARHVPGVFKAALPGTLVFMADGCFAVGFVGAFVVPVARGHERLHPAVGSGEGSDRRMQAALSQESGSNEGDRQINISHGSASRHPLEYR